MLGASAAVLALLAVVAWSIEGSWFAPGAMFSGYWAVLLAAAVFFRGSYPIPAAGPWFIVAAAVAVVCGGELRRSSSPVDHVARPVTLSSPWLLSASGIIGGAAGVLATALTLAQSGYSLTDVTSQSALLQVGNAVSIERYSGASTGLGVVSIALAVTYFGAAAAPFVLLRPRDQRSRFWWAPVVAPAAGAVLFSVLTTARLPMLLASGFTVLSTLVATSMRKGELVRMRPVQLLIGCALAAGLGASFLLIAFVRVGTTQASAAPAVYGSAKVYAVGGVSGFAQWLDGSVPPTAGPAPPSLTLGAGTFGAVSRQLGIDPQASRAYQAYASLDRQSGAATNIYTAFRSAIEDFGEPGALLFFAVLGYLATAAHQRAIGRADPLAAVVWVAIYAYVLNMNSQSVFWFTNVWLGLTLAAGSLAVTLRRRPAAGRDGPLLPDAG